MATKSKLFLRGVPTEPDVINLTKAFGVPREDEPITYGQVAAVIHERPDSNRFQSVTSAWRKGLRTTHGIIMLARDGQFTVRNPSERIAFGKTKVKTGVRDLTDAIDVVTGTDRARLSDKEKADGDKIQRIASMGQAAALAESRKRPAPMLKAVEKASGE